MTDTTTAATAFVADSAGYPGVEASPSSPTSVPVAATSAAVVVFTDVGTLMPATAHAHGGANMDIQTMPPFSIVGHTHHTHHTHHPLSGTQPAALVLGSRHLDEHGLPGTLVMVAQNAPTTNVCCCLVDNAQNQPIDNTHTHRHAEMQERSRMGMEWASPTVTAAAPATPPPPPSSSLPSSPRVDVLTTAIEDVIVSPPSMTVSLVPGAPLESPPAAPSVAAEVISASALTNDVSAAPLRVVSSSPPPSMDPPPLPSVLTPENHTYHSNSSNHVPSHSNAHHHHHPSSAAVSQMALVVSLEGPSGLLVSSSGTAGLTTLGRPAGVDDEHAPTAATTAESNAAAAAAVVATVVEHVAHYPELQRQIQEMGRMEVTSLPDEVAEAAAAAVVEATGVGAGAGAVVGATSPLTGLFTKPTAAASTATGSRRELRASGVFPRLTVTAVPTANLTHAVATSSAATTTTMTMGPAASTTTTDGGGVNPVVDAHADLIATSHSHHSHLHTHEQCLPQHITLSGDRVATLETAVLETAMHVFHSAQASSVHESDHSRATFTRTPESTRSSHQSRVSHERGPHHHHHHHQNQNHTATQQQELLPSHLEEKWLADHNAVVAVLMPSATHVIREADSVTSVLSQSSALLGQSPPHRRRSWDVSASLSTSQMLVHTLSCGFALGYNDHNTDIRRELPGAVSTSAATPTTKTATPPLAPVPSPLAGSPSTAVEWHKNPAVSSLPQPHPLLPSGPRHAVPFAVPGAASTPSASSSTQSRALGMAVGEASWVAPLPAFAAPPFAPAGSPLTSTSMRSQRAPVPYWAEGSPLSTSSAASHGHSQAFAMVASMADASVGDGGSESDVGITGRALSDCAAHSIIGAFSNAMGAEEGDVVVAAEALHVPMFLSSFASTSHAGSSKGGLGASSATDIVRSAATGLKPFRVHPSRGVESEADGERRAVMPFPAQPRCALESDEDAPMAAAVRQAKPTSTSPTLTSSLSSLASMRLFAGSQLGASGSLHPWALSRVVPAGSVNHHGPPLADRWRRSPALDREHPHDTLPRHPRTTSVTPSHTAPPLLMRPLDRGGACRHTDPHVAAQCEESGEVLSLPRFDASSPVTEPPLGSQRQHQPGTTRTTTTSAVTVSSLLVPQQHAPRLASTEEGADPNTSHHGGDGAGQPPRRHQGGCPGGSLLNVVSENALLSSPSRQRTLRPAVALHTPTGRHGTTPGQTRESLSLVEGPHAAVHRRHHHRHHDDPRSSAPMYSSEPENDNTHRPARHAQSGNADDDAHQNHSHHRRHPQQAHATLALASAPPLTLRTHVLEESNSPDSSFVGTLGGTWRPTAVHQGAAPLQGNTSSQEGTAGHIESRAPTPPPEESDAASLPSTQMHDDDDRDDTTPLPFVSAFLPHPGSSSSASTTQTTVSQTSTSRSVAGSSGSRGRSSGSTKGTRRAPSHREETRAQGAVPHTSPSTAASVSVSDPYSPTTLCLSTPDSPMLALCSKNTDPIACIPPRDAVFLMAVGEEEVNRREDDGEAGRGIASPVRSEYCSRCTPHGSRERREATSAVKASPHWLCSPRRRHRARLASVYTRSPVAALRGPEAGSFLASVSSCRTPRSWLRSGGLLPLLPIGTAGVPPSSPNSPVALSSQPSWFCTPLSVASAVLYQFPTPLWGHAAQSETHTGMTSTPGTAMSMPTAHTPSAQTSFLLPVYSADPVAIESARHVAGLARGEGREAQGNAAAWLVCAPAAHPFVSSRSSTAHADAGRLHTRSSRASSRCAYRRWSACSRRRFSRRNVSVEPVASPFFSGRTISERHSCDSANHCFVSFSFLETNRARHLPTSVSQTATPVVVAGHESDHHFWPPTASHVAPSSTSTTDGHRRSPSSQEPRISPWVSPPTAAAATGEMSPSLVVLRDTRQWSQGTSTSGGMASYVGSTITTFATVDDVTS